MNKIINKLRKFNKERDWEQFHTPKNISMALSVEASEIVEIFQWLTAEQSKELSDQRLSHLKEEIGDVFLYLLNLADFYNIDILEAASEKMIKNGKKYPIEKSRGLAKKYNEL